MLIMLHVDYLCWPAGLYKYTCIKDLTLFIKLAIYMIDCINLYRTENWKRWQNLPNVAVLVCKLLLMRKWYEV